MTESPSSSRIEDIKEFYDILACIEGRVKGCRTLAKCNGRMDWPKRGVYFFFEANEQRSLSGEGARVVRVGTHAIRNNSQTTLWKRLRRHRGSESGESGNHRKSVFRELIGEALAKRGDCQFPESWNEKVEFVEKEMGTNRSEIRNMELELEKLVGSYIGIMPFLWLNVPDDPSPNSKRAFIERNAIALLSNSQKNEIVDQASECWLGRYSEQPKVQNSGLWNRDYVDQDYDPKFLIDMKSLLQDWK